jgi:hypothetical protein
MPLPTLLSPRRGLDGGAPSGREAGTADTANDRCRLPGPTGHEPRQAAVKGWGSPGLAVGGDGPAALRLAGDCGGPPVAGEADRRDSGGVDVVGEGTVGEGTVGEGTVDEGTGAAEVEDFLPGVRPWTCLHAWWSPPDDAQRVPWPALDVTGRPLAGGAGGR